MVLSSFIIYLLIGSFSVMINVFRFLLSSVAEEDSNEINQCFLKHLRTAVVLLDKSFIFPRS